MSELSKAAAAHFLEELRRARATALADAEGFSEVLFAVERLGAFCALEIRSLANYGEELRSLARGTPLSSGESSNAADDCSRFERLFDVVVEARNDALHQGATARHIAQHCIDLALILEDALLSQTNKHVGDYMVRNPIEAKAWELVGSIRRTMLMNAFSYLPVRVEENWRLVSEAAVARYLRQSSSHTERKKRLATPLDAACRDGGLVLDNSPHSCVDTDDISTLLDKLDGRPILVLRADHGNDLVGIVTASDLL